MRLYGKKQDKYQLSVYLNEQQYNVIQSMVDRFGMNKSQIAVRMMFANGTEQDIRTYRRNTY
jgi:hypothetical protein